MPMHSSSSLSNHASFKCCPNNLKFLTSLSFFKSETYFYPHQSYFAKLPMVSSGHTQQVLFSLHLIGPFCITWQWVVFPPFFALTELSSSSPFYSLTILYIISLLLHSLLNVFPEFSSSAYCSPSFLCSPMAILSTQLLLTIS